VFGWGLDLAISGSFLYYIFAIGPLIRGVFPVSSLSP